MEVLPLTGVVPPAILPVPLLTPLLGSLLETPMRVIERALSSS